MGECRKQPTATTEHRLFLCCVLEGGAKRKHWRCCSLLTRERAWRWEISDTSKSFSAHRPFSHLRSLILAAFSGTSHWHWHPSPAHRCYHATAARPVLASLPLQYPLSRKNLATNSLLQDIRTRKIISQVWSWWMLSRIHDAFDIINHFIDSSEQCEITTEPSLPK